MYGPPPPPGGQGQQPPNPPPPNGWPHQPPPPQTPNGYPPHQHPSIPPTSQQPPQPPQQQQPPHHHPHHHQQQQQHQPPPPPMAAGYPPPHPHQEPYRLPAPGDLYRGPPPPAHDPYRQAPQHYNPHPQPAPRQRTAIACRYCRRRKIRCSGFDTAEDGRCLNCTRFSQECIFTPVSAQAQAFVPAHTVYRGQPGGQPQLYGAYGQPLPQTQPPPPPPPASHYPPPGHAHAHQPYPAMPSPTTGYPPAGVAGPVYPPPQPPYVDPNSRKRPAAEPHTPTLPPPNPATTAALPAQARSDYIYPDPTALTPGAASPASSANTAYANSQPPAQPYYSTQPAPRRGSPQSTYSYDNRASASPNTQGSVGTPATSSYSYPTPGQDPNLRPPQTSQPQAQASPQSLPIRSDGVRTPPGGRQGVSIRDLVGSEGSNGSNGSNGASSGRSATDNDMLKSLNRRV